MQAIVNSYDDVARYNALFGISSINSTWVPEHYATIIRRRNEAFHIRGTAAYFLGKTRASNAYLILTKTANDLTDDESVREGAVVGLGHLGDRRAIPLLERIARTAAENPFMRESAKQALLRISPEQYANIAPVDSR